MPPTCQPLCTDAGEPPEPGCIGNLGALCTKLGMGCGGGSCCACGVGAGPTTAEVIDMANGPSVGPVAHQPFELYVSANALVTRANAVYAERVMLPALVAWRRTHVLCCVSTSESRMLHARGGVNGYQPSS